MNSLLQTVDGLQELLAVCPCCGEIFRVVEAKFLFPRKPPRRCEYEELVETEERLSRSQERLDMERERFDRRLEERRARLTERGRAMAKRRLRKIDPVFSAKNIDPQDVKAIFDPIEYIIFHGLSADDLELVELVSRSPENRAQETLAKSIDDVVRKGHVEFETLRMRDDGSFEIQK